MSFPRYPSYKDSGVEWLGEVPEHWAVKRIGYYFNERREKVSDKDFPALSVTKNGIVPQLDTAAKSDDSDNRKKVSKGDFVINSRSDRKGSAGASELDGSVSLICTVLRPQEHVHTPFIHHLLRSQPFQEEFYRNGKGIVADLWSTNYSEMRNILLGMPPLHEQTLIAAFLDRETAKIDVLVAEQRRLMELLKEKRQAVIAHAVTQGINPHAPMKPSGIEWLGDIPEHWELKRLKYLGEAIIGLTYSPADIVDEGSGTLVLRSSNVQGGKIVFDDNVYVTTAIPEDLVTKVGDILICSRNGSRALIGKNAVIDESSAALTFGAFMTIFRSQHSAYLACVLNSPLFEFQSGAFMTSTINQLTVGVLNNFEVPLPPADEREQIAGFLKRETAKFNALTAEAQRAIDLLQERRTALISAAVTGQIDVRGLGVSSAVSPATNCV